MKRNNQKAVFLDRDGVINQERGDYTYTIKNFRFVAGVFQALKRWQAAGYLLIIITNQSGIAKGIYDHKMLEHVHQHMLKKLKSHNIVIKDVLYCPHHPKFSKCLCRKPQSLLIEKAVARYHINPAKSFMIGDKKRDLQAGEKVQLNPIKVAPNTDLNQITLSI